MRWREESGNDNGSDSNLCLRGRSSLYMVGATGCATVPPEAPLLIGWDCLWLLVPGLCVNPRVFLSANTERTTKGP